MSGWLVVPWAIAVGFEVLVVTIGLTNTGVCSWIVGTGGLGVDVVVVGLVLFGVGVVGKKPAPTGNAELGVLVFGVLTGRMLDADGILRSPLATGGLADTELGANWLRDTRALADGVLRSPLAIGGLADTELEANPLMDDSTLAAAGAADVADVEVDPNEPVKLVPVDVEVDPNEPVKAEVASGTTRASSSSSLSKSLIFIGKPSPHGDVILIGVQVAGT